MLEDGIYDAIVVDAEPSATEEDAVDVELTVLAGPHKGEMVTVSARGLGRDPLDLLAVPATIEVRNGSPLLTLEG